jgi:hypothetical protein
VRVCTRAGVSVVVALNPAFSDLSCLRRLTSIEGDLVLTFAPITSLADLSNIKSVKLNLVVRTGWGGGGGAARIHIHPASAHCAQPWWQPPVGSLLVAILKIPPCCLAHAPAPDCACPFCSLASCRTCP